ncbi:MAG: hypothetical protein ACFWTJ_09490 [Lachnoclostridium sp.]|jgi:methyl-accepting chemotaxis protein
MKKHRREENEKNKLGKKAFGKKTFSIKAKLVLYFTLLILMTCTTLTIISYKFARDTILKETENNILEQAEDASKLLNSRIEKYKNNLETNSLSNLVTDMGYGTNGYGYIIDGNGTIIGHKNKDYVNNQFNPINEAKNNKSLEELAATIQLATTKSRGISHYTFNSQNYYAAFSKVSGTDWTIIITAEKSEILQPAITLLKSMVFVVFIVLIISAFLTFVIGTKIASPIRATSNYAMKIASLDLSQDIDDKYREREDEIGRLAYSLHSITNNLRHIIKNINESSDQVAHAANLLTENSKQTATAAEEISKTIEEIAEGASEQAKHTESGSHKAALLGESIEKVHNIIQDVNSSTDKVTAVVQEGLKEIEALIQITKENIVAVKTIYDVIMKTNESSKQIGEASNVIESIASQTNLLSLNAAIEAARAGDAGKGFAVVADEIRKLADQSSSSTKVINQIIEELQRNINNAVQTMTRITSITEEQSTSVKNTKEKYMSIEKSMQVSIDAVRNLKLAGDEMDNMRQNILDSLENLSAIAEENAAASEEASASTEEQTAAIEEFAHAIDNLSGLAAKLESLISEFKL